MEGPLGEERLSGTVHECRRVRCRDGGRSSSQHEWHVSPAAACAGVQAWFQMTGNRWRVVKGKLIKLLPEELEALSCELAGDADGLDNPGPWLGSAADRIYYGSLQVWQPLDSMQPSPAPPTAGTSRAADAWG